MRKLHLDKDWGLFVGRFENNSFHKHYATQLSIGLDELIQIENVNRKIIENDHCIIKGNVEHKLHCLGHQILFLFDPFSKIGHYLQNKTRQSIESLNECWIKEIQMMGKNYINGDFSFEILIQKITIVMNNLNCDCSNGSHINEDRINLGIAYLQDNYERTIPLDEIAEYVNLSASRFLHLFKSTTGMTYRRAQLWNKIQASLNVLNMQTITQTAHQFGFADSAHYSRVFKENFGFTPKFISKM